VQKIFGSDDPLGKSLRISAQENDYKITGIMKDVPANSHLEFSFMISFISHKTRNRNLDDWYRNSYFTYVQLQERTDTREFEKKISIDTPLKDWPITPAISSPWAESIFIPILTSIRL
jgi:putative ABC transport system permease protein